MNSLEQIKKSRLKKRKSLKALGQNPYSLFVTRTHTIEEALGKFSEFAKSKKQVVLAGRLMSLRTHGGVSFGDIKDGTSSIQLAFRKDALGNTAYQEIEKNLDMGDFVSAKGNLFKTKRGEKTLDVSNFDIISKSILPLPEKWHGLKDTEQRYRKRYLDILLNDEAKSFIETRALVLRFIREYLNQEGFLEVETPVLQVVAGGASARPFETHLNALNLDLYLRISPELYLKRLLVAGLEKVYELGRNFRNEGIDYAHNPEFTMLEFYWAYNDYKEGMKFTEKFLSTIIKQILSKKEFEYAGEKISLKTPWERIEFNELLQKYTKINYEDYNFEALKKKADDLGVKIEKSVYSKAQVADYIYKKICLPKLKNPTFVIHHPAEMLPLAKPFSNKPEYAASFQLIIAGWEMVKAYSELNDPVMQREFFKAQQELFRKGDKEAQALDEEFIEALEYGMPPALGFGLGIDRFVALLTNAHSLREVIAFPTLKPK